MPASPCLHRLRNSNLEWQKSATRSRRSGPHPPAPMAKRCWPRTGSSPNFLRIVAYDAQKQDSGVRLAMALPVSDRRGRMTRHTKARRPLIDLLGGHLDLCAIRRSMFCSQRRVDCSRPLPRRLRSASRSRLSFRSWRRPGRLQMGVWYAPKGTPKPIIDKLSAALQKALQDPDVQERLAQSGAETVSAERAMPEVLRDHLKAEIDRWVPLIRKAGVWAQ